MGGQLVVIGSAAGAPGVTTLALGLAVCWPISVRSPRPLVMEVDPSGGDIAARFGLSDSPGLVDLAAATRRSVAPQVLRECVQVLPGGVHVAVGPSGARQAAAAVRMVSGVGAGLLRAGMGSEGSVLLDAGRLQAESAPLVDAADRLLLVSGGEVEALAHAAAKVEDLRVAGRSVELVLVGPSPYPLREISGVLGLQQVHRVPWDPRTASVLAGRGQLSPRRWRRAELVRAAGTLARHLVGIPSQNDSPCGVPCPSTDRGMGSRPLTAGVVDGGGVR
jgi:hypothetical protein